jgi:PIN domain nuclease of toxin-antitoxin system
MKGRKPGALHKFSWSTRAITYAVKLATLHEVQSDSVQGVLDGKPVISPVTYRTIAAELHARGFVDQQVDSATVRRMVVNQIGKERAAR